MQAWLEALRSEGAVVATGSEATGPGPTGLEPEAALEAARRSEKAAPFV